MSTDINGTEYDFSSIEISPDSGAPIKEIVSIEYSQALEPGEKRGTAARWLGRTRGQYKPEASFEMYKAEANAFVKRLGPKFMMKVFDIPVTYADDGQPTISDLIKGCRIKKISDSPKAGSESPTVKFELHVKEIFLDGLSAV